MFQVRVRNAMPSPVYERFVEAMRKEMQILCIYDGHVREVWPVMVGQTEGEEKALVFQTGGGSNQRLPAKGAWKCFQLSKVRNIKFRTRRSQPSDEHRQVAHQGGHARH